MMMISPLRNTFLLAGAAPASTSSMASTSPFTVNSKPSHIFGLKCHFRIKEPSSPLILNYSPKAFFSGLLSGWFLK